MCSSNLVMIAQIVSSAGRVSVVALASSETSDAWISSALAASPPRLAVASAWQGHGLGKALLRDAILRTLQVSDVVGVRALLVHALSERAAGFYEAQGFHPSPVHPRTLFLPLSEV